MEEQWKKEEKQRVELEVSKEVGTEEEELEQKEGHELEDPATFFVDF